MRFILFYKENKDAANRQRKRFLESLVMLSNLPLLPKNGNDFFTKLLSPPQTPNLQTIRENFIDTSSTFLLNLMNLNNNFSTMFKDSLQNRPSLKLGLPFEKQPFQFVNPFVGSQDLFAKTKNQLKEATQEAAINSFKFLSAFKPRPPTINLNV